VKRHLTWSWRANGWYEERANAYWLWLGDRWEEWQVVKGTREQVEEMIQGNRVPVAWKLDGSTTEWKWFPRAH
jgi:hypothetical protein